MRKVLIANRGEIAVRVARACRDAGIASVAVYADPDRDALHVRAADEAFALGGDTPATSYLDIDKVLKAARESGADAIHPGYGFLSENADFAQAVLDAGLIWIGPPPQAIRDLGDKVAARHIAQRAGAPLVAGTPDPVSGADEVVAFAREHGLPIAIKAAFGGGGRGLKVARTLEEVPELYESAVREAVAAFGRGECFVERYLDKPRHVETQCLADTHGNVVVVSTRDCSLQRRHQKLVEEAPAPFLSEAQVAELYSSSKAILKEAGYVGAGTVEFLVGMDGTISFLEVNTRLQVEHPVTEEVTGIDLVREMFRIADGEALGYDDPALRGHSFEFRINGEDPGRGFLPAPGTVTTFTAPTGPGVRLDAGVESGSVIGPAWDSLLAKLIVTGATREQALQRAARALAEFQVEGMATAIPFHRAVVTDPAFAPELTGSTDPFTVHTRWIETEFVNEIKPFAAPADTDDGRGPGPRDDRRRGRRQAPGGLPPVLARHVAGPHRPRRRRQAQAPRGQEVRPRRLRRHPRLPDAGHHRQGRRRGRPGSQGRRPDRRTRSDEDGTAAERAQVRHRQGPVRRGRRLPHLRRPHLRDQGLTHTAQAVRHVAIRHPRRPADWNGQSAGRLVAAWRDGILEAHRGRERGQVGAMVGATSQEGAGSGSPAAATSAQPRAMRADARRNHDRLVTEARSAFAAHGTDASLEDVARRAGVGIGTLYRHFPNRDALLSAVFEDAVGDLLTRSRELLHAPEPCAALVTWLREMVTHAGEYRGLARSLMSVSYDNTSALARCSGPIREAGGALLARAQESGTVRPDVSIGDLLQLTHAIALAAEETPGDPDLADRLLHLTLRGLKPTWGAGRYRCAAPAAWARQATNNRHSRTTTNPTAKRRT